MKLERCPTCNQHLPPAKVCVTGPRRQFLLDYVLRHSQGVSRQQILEYVWNDDPNGGPEDSKIVHVMVCNINKQLEKQGLPLRLRGRTGDPGSVYKAVYL